MSTEIPLKKKYRTKPAAKSVKHAGGGNNGTSGRKARANKRRIVPLKNDKNRHIFEEEALQRNRLLGVATTEKVKDECET